MYAEVEEYFRTANLRERDYARAIRDADYAFQNELEDLRWKAEDEGRRYDSYGDDRDATRACRSRRDAACEAAEEAKQGTADARNLLLNSEHKEVAWIAREILFNNKSSEVEGHAKTILRALPATTEQLWTLAKDDHGMCEVFDEYFSQAEAAGIFGEKETIAAREMAALRNYIRRTYGSGYVVNFQRHLDPALKAIKADYERKLAEAKAEWQQLDAAHAENVHRNRSEGARRAAETRRRNAELAATEEAEIPTKEPGYDSGPIRYVTV